MAIGLLFSTMHLDMCASNLIWLARKIIANLKLPLVTINDILAYTQQDRLIQVNAGGTEAVASSQL